MPVPENAAFVGSISRAYAANISNTVPLTNGKCRGLYLGTAGNVSVVFENGETAVFENLAAGVIHPIAAYQITDTNTDELTDILVCY